LSYEDKIFQKFPIRSFKRGQLLIFQGEVPRYGYVLKDGIIKEYDISSQGNEQTTWLINRYEVFPFPWLIGAANIASYYYETASDCKLYVLDRQSYLKLINDDHEFLLGELTNQAKKEMYQTRRLAAILNIKAKAKLVNTFQYLVETYGKLLKDGLVEINIPLTHQDIANLTGLTRETVSKEIGLMKKSGLVVIPTNRSIYAINISKLNQLVSTPLSNLTFLK
jgi:CRP/FNR family cyclic AMP-dependent transcriptional regulator